MPNWSEVIDEIETVAKVTPLDRIRRKYLERLNAYTERNTIAYYSGWLSKGSQPSMVINDHDKNGFMTCVHNLDRSLGLDLLLHTPGGDVAATESIVDYLRKMFSDDIRAFVPQMAMSAGTMIACSCKTIHMGKHSCLGPIDPQINGISARGVITEFERAHREINADHSRMAVWQFILNKYNPNYLQHCEKSLEWAEIFVRTQLEEVMFGGEKDKKSKAESVVSFLMDYDSLLSHARHVHPDKCKEIGLCVVDLESDNQLQDLVLTVHHCYMHTLDNTGVIKIVENHKGVAQILHQGR